MKRTLTFAVKFQTDKRREQTSRVAADGDIHQDHASRSKERGMEPPGQR